MRARSPSVMLKHQRQQQLAPNAASASSTPSLPPTASLAQRSATLTPSPPSHQLNDCVVVVVVESVVHHDSSLSPVVENTAPESS